MFRILKPSIRTLPFVSKSTIRNVYTKTNTFPKFPTSHRAIFGISIGALASITVYNQHIDNDVHALDTSVHTLTPSKTSETFEMGLYESSQKEEYNQYYGYRETKKKHQVGLFEHFII